MKTTNQEYDAMSKKAAPPSKVLAHCVTAFLVGGAICTLGQLMTDLYGMAGLNEELARLASTVSLVLLSALCTAFRFYDNIAKYAGAGTLVPITGFANSIVSAAMEFKSEGYITGLGVKMFIIAGPVLVYGSVAPVIFGLIIWILRLF